MKSVSFLLVLIRGDVYSYYLSRKINFMVQLDLFVILNFKFQCSVYANNDSFHQICPKFNNIYHLIDISESNYFLERKII